MTEDPTAPMETFEVWFLHRVARAVEAGEVPADLLADLQAEFEVARKRAREEGYAAAIRHIAGLASVPEDEARSALEAIEAQPAVTREMVMWRFAGAWREGQRKAHPGRPRFDGCPRRGLSSGPPGGGAGPEVGPTPGETWQDDVTCRVPHYALHQVKKVS